jgi:Protein of unknown function (DUF2997)
VPEIEFTIDHRTGKTSMKVKGVKGKACKPIHEAFSRDLAAGLGAIESHSEDTPEMNETETLRNTEKLRLRS